MTLVRDFEQYCWRDVVANDLVAIYAPYRRSRTVPPRSTLLILHPKPSMALTVQPEWKSAAARILTQARGLSLPVVHSVPPDADPSATFERCDGDLVLPRPCDSAFMFSELPAVLKRQRAGGLLLCGATTSGALRATAVEAKSYGYKVAIAEEATADEAAVLHKMALFDIAHKYGDVMALDELLGSMEAR